MFDIEISKIDIEVETEEKKTDETQNPLSNLKWILLQRCHAEFFLIRTDILGSMIHSLA